MSLSSEQYSEGLKGEKDFSWRAQAVRCRKSCIGTTLKKYENTLNQYYGSLRANICFLSSSADEIRERRKETESEGWWESAFMDKRELFHEVHGIVNKYLNRQLKPLMEENRNHRAFRNWFGHKGFSIIYGNSEHFPFLPLGDSVSEKKRSPRINFPQQISVEEKSTQIRLSIDMQIKSCETSINHLLDSWKKTKKIYFHRINCHFFDFSLVLWFAYARPPSCHIISGFGKWMRRISTTVVEDEELF